jgi:hypothetical protein
MPLPLGELRLSKLARQGVLTMPVWWRDHAWFMQLLQAHAVTQATNSDPNSPLTNIQ